MPAGAWGCIVRELPFNCRNPPLSVKIDRSPTLILHSVGPQPDHV